MIRAANSADAQQLTDIYNHYIRNTVVTFEEKIISHVKMLAGQSASLNTGTGLS